VDMQISNAKLHHRAVGMIIRIAKCDQPTAETALNQAGGNIKIAILLSVGVNMEKAKNLLFKYDGNLRSALEAIIGRKQTG